MQITKDDFHRNEDGSWLVARDIVISSDVKEQTMLKEGRVFRKGELAIVGLDLAAILEKHGS